MKTQTKLKAIIAIQVLTIASILVFGLLEIINL